MTCSNNVAGPLLWRKNKNIACTNNAITIQKVVTTYFTSKQLLPFGFAEQHIVLSAFSSICRKIRDDATGCGWGNQWNGICNSGEAQTLDKYFAWSLNRSFPENAKHLYNICTTPAQRQTLGRLCLKVIRMFCVYWAEAYAVRFWDPSINMTHCLKERCSEQSNDSLKILKIIGIFSLFEMYMVSFWRPFHLKL